MYAACNGLCLNAECPLRPITGDTCDNMLASRVRALADTPEPRLTTLIKTAKTPGSYHNQIFPCDNKNCVLYKNVCDLKDDCRDGSDERHCTNHFKCHNSKVLEITAVTQVCDGVADCRDFSDECNANCPSTNKNIFGYDALRAASAVMGFLATSLNLLTLTKFLWELRSQKSYETFLNKSAIALICLGDLCIGMYLVAISYFDFQYRSDGNYCQQKYVWLTSSECSMLGVLSTTGSQLSLFAMTILSIARVSNVGSFVKKPLKSRKSACKLVLLLLSPILTSVLVACIPILPSLEDYFVNGIYYHGSPLFIRPLSKRDHYVAFNEYIGGNWERMTLSWKQVRDIVAGMFSADHQGR